MDHYPNLSRILADNSDYASDTERNKLSQSKDLQKMLKRARVSYEIKQDFNHTLPYADVGGGRKVNFDTKMDREFVLWSPKTGGVIFRTPEELQYLQSLNDEEVGKIHEELQLTPHGVRYKPFMPDQV